jgi:lipid-A-disaccharide synthase
MVTFYKVTAASWLMGRLLVRVPFYSMVNLIAGRAVVPELMQSNLTGERLAAEAQRLLGDEFARTRMRADLAEVAARLSGPGRPSPQGEPMTRASAIIVNLMDLMEGQLAHVS